MRGVLIGLVDRALYGPDDTSNYYPKPPQAYYQRKERRVPRKLVLLRWAEGYYLLIGCPLLWWQGLKLFLALDVSSWWLLVVLVPPVAPVVAVKRWREKKEAAILRRVMRTQLARHLERTGPVMEKWIRQSGGSYENDTSEENDIFNGRALSEEDFRPVPKEWAQYDAAMKDYYRRVREAEAERERREREARERARRAERERPERQAREARERAERERHRAKTGGYSEIIPETYEAALTLLKLREGHVTRSTFNKHYRRAMQAVHPDLAGGTKEQAQSVNAARELIKKRHGWK
ncbi:MAG: hypothetical protein Q8P46_03375 [Hyphomicrobiales bacterium]|nr:hypothetical protein [Hyphomicrobiales bacterium]